jgi:hypothetical protein
MNYKIYGLKIKNTDLIRYVGMTSNSLQNRLNEHIRYTSKQKSKNGFWLKKYGYDVEVVLIEDDIQTKKEAYDKEKMYIKLFKSFGAILTNGTEGGEGGRQTDEVRKIISQKGIGRIVSKETRDKISKTMKGRPFIGNKNGFEIEVYDLDEKYIGTYISIRECAKDLNIPSGHISRCINGQRNRVSNYKFKKK